LQLFFFDEGVIEAIIDAQLWSMGTLYPSWSILITFRRTEENLINLPNDCMILGDGGFRETRIKQNCQNQWQPFYSQILLVGDGMGAEGIRESPYNANLLVLIETFSYSEVLFTKLCSS
jgi:hypothetical protein